MPAWKGEHWISLPGWIGFGSSQRRRPYLPDMSMRSEHEDPATGWVLYDGACGICSRWVPRWAPVLVQLGLRVAPLQSSWVEERTGLSQGVLLEQLRLLHNDGTLTSGADVYRYVMRRIWWLYPLYLFSVTPGLRRAFDWGYRTFAQHRVRISATCGLPQPGRRTHG
jgi:predicted DCC family thiol-disulfide oxidoreductase YuxK